MTITEQIDAIRSCLITWAEGYNKEAEPDAVKKLNQIFREQNKEIEKSGTTMEVLKSLVGSLMDGLRYGNWPWIDYSKVGKQ